MTKESSTPETGLTKSNTQPPTPPANAKELFSDKKITNKFHELLGKRAPQFMTSVLQVVNGNDKLRTADPLSIYNAAATAATMDLPVNQNLGFSWIVPYQGKAQFQMGYKGYIQLAQRTGQYLRINVVEVYANQFKSFNALTEELDVDFAVEGTGEAVGYCAYFKMVNGFEKTIYWTKAKVNAHGSKYSQMFGKGVWKTEYDKMAKKTVLKNALASWGYLSIELQMAMKVDQAVIKDENATEVEYPDRKDDGNDVDHERERLKQMIETCTKPDELEALSNHLTPGDQELSDLYDKKMEELKGKKQ